MPVTLNGTNGLLQNYTTNTPTTGFSYTVTTPVTLFTPAGTLATGTVTMPASPNDGMTVTLMTTQTITALTVSANSGQSIAGAATTLLANASVTYVYRSSNTTWYPFATGMNPVGLASIRSTSANTPTKFQDSAGTEVGTLCRAWVNFVGSSGSVNSSFNVSSVTRNATGDFTINFTTAMPNANYVATYFGRQNATTTFAAYQFGCIDFSVAPTTSALRIRTIDNNTYADSPINQVAIFA